MLITNVEIETTLDYDSVDEHGLYTGVAALILRIVIPGGIVKYKFKITEKQRKSIEYAYKLAQIEEEENQNADKKLSR